MNLRISTVVVPTRLTDIPKPFNYVPEPKQWTITSEQLQSLRDLHHIKCYLDSGYWRRE